MNNLIALTMFLVLKQRFHIVSCYVPAVQLRCNHNNIIDCWDLKGASVERCGPMFASAPQNLTVTGTLVNQSSVMLHISWTPPAQYTPDIEAYKISISGNCYCNNGVIADTLILLLCMAQAPLAN